MRFIILATVLLATMPIMASATEEPPHQTLIKDGKFEIRAYESTIVAEVEVTGDMRRAGNSGFRPLADFIFGNNTAQIGIEMTAPVTRVRSEKIAMTAPVTRTPAENGAWTVAFVMPDSWTMETLPMPNNPDVSIREVPGETMATIRFSGIGRAEAFEKKQIALEAWIEDQGYEVIGAPRFAGYDAPYVPGPFRRNEVMIPVTAKAAAN